MEKKVLVAVDDSIHSKKALEYAAASSLNIKDLHYILINIQPKLSDFLLDESRTDPKARAALDRLIKRNQDTSAKLLEDRKTLMIRKGIAEDYIETVSQPAVMGTAKDILNYAEHRICDAIITGRRGVSRLEEMFTGSVTNALIEHAVIIPIWAIGGNVKSAKMMVAIDGSESALNAVDHVSFMISGNPDVHVTLLHVTPKLRDYCTIEFDDKGDAIEDVIVEGDKRCVSDFYIHASNKFEQAGIDKSQIEIKEVESTLNIGRAIVNQAKKGKYGVVVVGRRGMNKTFFMGSVSNYVINNTPNCAVWLVP